MSKIRLIFADDHPGFRSAVLSFLQRSDEQEHLAIKIVAFSVYREEEYIRGIHDYGGAGYLLKSETPDTLLSVLRHVVDGESGFYSKAAIQILRDAGYAIEDRPLQD